MGMSVCTRALVALASLPVLAQLAIPGLLEDTPVEEQAPAIFIPAPERTDGLHAGTNAPAEISLPAGALSQDARGILRMMEGPNPIFLRQDFGIPRPGPRPSFLTGPSNVVFGMELTQGESLGGALRNQPLLIDTQAGRMVVSLHEVAAMERLEDTDVFRIELRGGDVVTGQVATAHLNVQQADGGTRRVPATRWRSLVPRK